MSRRSCDRCYAIKAKCQPGRCNVSCRRCERLRHHCETVRSVGKAGRPRTTTTTTTTTTTRERTTLPLLPQPLPIQSLKLAHPSDKSILEFLFSTSHFIPHFVIGPSFARSMQHALQTRFFLSPETVLEGFVACAAEFAHRTGLHALTERNIARSAHAIRKLRSIAPTDLPQIATMLALGTSILTYDQLAALEGASMICQYLLSQVKPWYPRLAQLPELDFELNCLIHLDTVECLVRRELPVLRLEVRGGGVVDRYVGLVYSLLPVLYDVCVLGWEVKRRGAPGLVADGMLEECWERVRRDLLDWQPSPPEDFTSLYTGNEVVSMCTQANVYRQAGLLLLHRHRYPFGTEDTTAMVYADAIFAEIETCRRIAGDVPFQIGLLPLLVAGFEVVDPVAREMGLIHRHFNAKSGIYAFPHRRARQLLRLVWRERDIKENVSWFDLVSALPTFGYIP
ncbi:hypothetical protein BJY01DRAFT_236531 [Aspergillus pseudoustus]|uniref:Zn(2)-C6 fungal-type domain-containing protein n=1 Tax=Aspergillus pseudoustus TaxID=1810923 RepID=A0ABR4JLX9_9EURO